MKSAMHGIVSLSRKFLDPRQVTKPCMFYRHSVATLCLSSMTNTILRKCTNLSFAILCN